MPSPGSMAAWRATLDTCRRKTLARCTSSSGSSSENANSGTGGVRSGATSSCSGSSGSRRIPPIGRIVHGLVAASLEPAHLARARRLAAAACSNRRPDDDRPNLFQPPAAEARAPATAGPHSSALSARGLGGIRRPEPVRRPAASCMTSPGVRSGRAVSCRETMRCPSHGLSLWPA